MIKVELDKRFPQFLPNIFVAGAAFYNGECLKEARLAQYFAEVKTKGDFEAKLKALNGFFAVVIRNDSMLLAAVDRVRSIPLFYGHMAASFVIVSQADLIKASLSCEIDTTSAAEFLLSGYVTGQNTLFKNIFQLQAGEWIVVEPDGACPKYELATYATFRPGLAGDLDPQRAMECVISGAEQSIQNLISYADGKRILVPLSGGLDSRLICLLLKKFQYDNLAAFCYGTETTAETRISKIVAAELNIPWHFIHYSPQTWADMVRSQAWLPYLSYGHNGVSVSHIQDFPALLRLKEVFPDLNNSIITPGHTGDFVSGGHIPPAFLRKQRVSHQDICSVIRHNHYYLSSVDKVANFLRIDTAKAESLISSRLSDCVKASDYNSPAQAAAAYEEWEFKERQCKFIINSVRAYEFFDLKWWLPLWDNFCSNSWILIPLNLRIDKKIYIDYITSLSSKSGTLSRLIPKPFKHRILRKCLRTDFLGNLVETYLILRKKFAFKLPSPPHYLGWNPVMNTLPTNLRTYTSTVNTAIAHEIFQKNIVGN